MTSIEAAELLSMLEFDDFGEMKPLRIYYPGIGQDLQSALDIAVEILKQSREKSSA